jgi:hypothetical protein
MFYPDFRATTAGNVIDVMVVDLTRHTWLMSKIIQEDDGWQKQDGASRRPTSNIISEPKYPIR